MRPLIADVVTALKYLAAQTYDPQTQPPVQGHRCRPSSHWSKSQDDNKAISDDNDDEREECKGNLSGE